MKIPRYWKQVFRQVDGISFDENYRYSFTEGKADIYAWGYSDISMEEALERANERVAEIVEALSSGPNDGFYYPLSVLHEDIIETLDTGDCGAAIVTRNRYHSQVLNTANMMFVDIDIPTHDLKPATLWQKLFGKAKAIEASNNQEVENRVKNVLVKVSNYVANKPLAGFLVYRTFAGLRLIASDSTFDPCSDEVQKTFDALGADPLYQKLCKVQGSFRARLTPKHWRLGKNLGRSPNLRYRLTKMMVAKWTKYDSRRLKQYDTWLETYEAEHQSHASCRFIKPIGDPQIAAPLKRLIEYHDRVTQAHSDKPLA